jgi:hypothetical protein
MRLTGNKGEWSELYVLLALLAEGKLFAAGENVKRIDSVFFPILKILREEQKKQLYEYRLSSETAVEVYLNGEKRKAISREALAEYAKYLYQRIKEGGDRAFPIDRAEEIMGELECEKIVAPSSDKTDITMQLHDVQTGYDPICGFSIKSELGSAPTLLNASGATNFVFEIDGLTDQQMDEINAIETKHKILDRVARILQYGSLAFKKADSPVFADNLMMIDSRMEEIIAEMLLCHYSTDTKGCEAVALAMEEQNPLKFPRKGLYEYKMKKFLCSVALGMNPSKEWDGHDEANGGYIIVTTDGDVLAYHIYNRDFFESYLLKNTKFEHGSSSRHKYASIYKEDGKMYIKLNLQIRFK